MNKDQFENGGLYRLLPVVVRQRDEQTEGQLSKTLVAFGQQADRIAAKITRSYDDFFVETADPQALRYIADLVGYRPISTPEPAGATTDSVTGLLRRDIGRTIWARRRKGTAEVIGTMITAITGWRSAVFENGKNVVATPSIRFAASPPAPQGTPDIRKLRGPAGTDQGPGLIPRVATVGRADVQGGRRRWHPLDVVVEIWPHRSESQTRFLEVVRVRLKEHVPLEARAGLIIRHQAGEGRCA